jgi:peptidoglycan/xylan/chitin deacetylase (PgdA/CDA1 family)
MRRTLSLIALGSFALLGAASCADDGGDLHCDENGDNCTDDTDGMEAAYQENQEPWDEKADGPDCSGVRMPDRTGFNKHIALTFDDGPNPATTPKVIEILHKHHAPATFFENGYRINSAAARALSAQIAADPDFMLGNHSQNHLDLAKQTTAKVTSEMDLTDTLLKAAGDTPKYFRFPFGSSTCNTKAMAQNRGWTVVGWTIDSADWCYAGNGGTYCAPATFGEVPDAMRHNMLGYIESQVKAGNGGVILMHDIHASTANNLDAILTMLENDGFIFSRLDDATVFPKLNGVTPPPQKFIGDKCTTDADCAFTANGEAGHCHAAGFCTISCAGTCPDLDGKAGTFCIADGITATKGVCVSKGATQNQNCASLPNTVLSLKPRFLPVGSTISAAQANVCAPR